MLQLQNTHTNSTRPHSCKNNNNNNNTQREPPLLHIHNRLYFLLDHTEELGRYWKMVLKRILTAWNMKV